MISGIMAKTYTITTKCTMLEPYWQALKDGSHPEIEYTDKQVYRKLPEEAAKMVLNEFLDAPDHEMTLEEAKKEFFDSNQTMSDETAKKIVDYYNGRKSIFDNLVSLLGDEFEYEKVAIPEELNGFTTQENDTEFEKGHTLEAWIEVRTE